MMDLPRTTRGVGVLLDVDGTLVDSTYLHTAAWQQVFAHNGLAAPWWRIHRAIGMGGDRLVRHLLGASIEHSHGDRLRAGWQERYRTLLPQVTPIAGVARWVRNVRDHGVPVALASSSIPEFTGHALGVLGFDEHDVDVVTTSSDVGESKPAPEVLAVAAQRLNVTRVVVVGDSTWDAHAAARMGAPCIGVRTGGVGDHELTAAGCVHVQDSVADISLSVIIGDAAPAPSSATNPQEVSR